MGDENKEAGGASEASESTQEIAEGMGTKGKDDGESTQNRLKALGNAERNGGRDALKRTEGRRNSRGWVVGGELVESIVESVKVDDEE